MTVFVAGDAAIDRHTRVLLDFDESRLVTVGRPQLDVERSPALPHSPRRTVMYAPTWEGENDANNYTSVDTFGEQIIAALLATPDTRVVYQPHPRIETSPDTRILEADARIWSQLEASISA